MTGCDRRAVQEHHSPIDILRPWKREPLDQTGEATEEGYHDVPSITQINDVSQVVVVTLLGKSGTQGLAKGGTQPKTTEQIFERAHPITTRRRSRLAGGQSLRES